jgi:uroporphyrin-III C-methyltransferase
LAQALVPLTLRALRALEAASVVLYDALVSDEILALIPADARKSFSIQILS